ncbi:iron ABC transporter permease, partial [Pseudomonas syringae pv. actinidifoliorum]|nr:iron ABC transporter permease [Pseudomonas syringae pv. actinidifoliorum]
MRLPVALGHLFWVAALLVLAIMVGAAIGETSISLDVVFQVLANKLWAAGYVLDPIDEGIVWNYSLT